MTSAASNSEFSHEFERETCASLLRSERLLAQLAPVLRAEHFTHPAHKDFIRTILDFYHHYQRRPNEDEFIEQVALILEPMNDDNKKEEYMRVLEDILTREPSFGDDYAADKATEFCRYQAMVTAINESAEIVRKGRDYSQIGEKISAALTIGSGSELDTVTLSEVEMKSVEWLWKEKIPKSKLTLLVGDPNVGKSFFTTMMMAHVSQGRPWPTEPSFRVEKGSVILLTAEDGLEDTVAPRIANHNGDLSKVVVIRGTRVGRGEVRWFDLVADLKHLENEIERIRDVRLIIIDPVSAYIGAKIDTHRERDVRGALSPLAALAERRNVSIVGVVHMNKSQDLQAIYRVSGSMAFVAAARAVWLIARDKEESARRHFVALKYNLIEKPIGFSFEIRDGQVVIDTQSSPPDVEELVGATKPHSPEKLAEAEKFLKEILKSGPMPAKKVVHTAKLEGIAEDTLRRAKKRLGITSIKCQQEDGEWVWSM